MLDGTPVHIEATISRLQVFQRTASNDLAGADLWRLAIRPRHCCSAGAPGAREESLRFYPSQALRIIESISVVAGGAMR